MKLCHMTCHKVGIITYIQHLGARPLKIWEGKNVQNSARFMTTLTLVIGADVDLLNSTMCILRVLMHFSLGHVILLPWVFRPTPRPNFSPNRTYGARWPYVELCPMFLVSVRSFKVTDFDVNRKERIILPNVYTLGRSKRFFGNLTFIHSSDGWTV